MEEVTADPVRLVALELALQHHNAHNVDVETEMVLATAQKFYEFLKGTNANG